MKECACAMAALMAIVRLCHAIAYYPADGVTYDLNDLLQGVQACLNEF